MVELELLELGQSAISLLGRDELYFGGLGSARRFRGAQKRGRDEDHRRRRQQGAQEQLDAHARESASARP